MTTKMPEFDENSIAIIGMAGRFAGAQNVDQYWQNLRDGVESIQHYSREQLLAAGVTAAQLDNPGYVGAGAPLEDMECFDPNFFGFNPREAEILDPQHRHFLELCWTAFEDAGHDPAKFDGPIAVYGGSGHNAYMPYNLMTNPQLMDSVGLFLVRHTGNDKDFMVTRASYCLNLTGPAINVQTACSTSLVAIHLACQSLLSGESDMALAGGVTIELPHRHGYQYEEGEILSPDGHCRPFDADSKGTVFGSGGGVVLLRPLAEAYENGDHIHAVIRGSAINNDGAGKVGYLAPSVGGQAACIAEALAISGVEAEQISYVETHGTGTPVGDPIEIAALSQAYSDQTSKTGFCGIGSVKSNIGHTDTAAGVASLIKTVMALKHRQLPPTLHYKEANPNINFQDSPFRVNDRLRDWHSDDLRRAGVSSLGVGGTNAHLIVEEAPPKQSVIASEHRYPLLLSAASAAALERRKRQLAEHFRALEIPSESATETCPESTGIADIAYTLALGRQSMKYRFATSFDSLAAGIEQLDSDDSALTCTTTAADSAEGVTFMFAGGGAQYPMMAVGLYAHEAVFRDQLESCLQMLAPLVDYDPIDQLYPKSGQTELSAELMQQPTVGLPLLFCVQYAQAKLWMSWGVQPQNMIGHSMGEYTAACLAGVFSLADAIALVVLRGQLFERVEAGAMLSVGLPAEEVLRLLGSKISLAAINSTELCVVSGDLEAIDALEQQLDQEDVGCTRIHIKVAAHSHMLESILERFRDRWESVNLQPPNIPIASNLTGDWLTDEQAMDADYWVAHLRGTVRFHEGLSLLLGATNTTLIEVGPGRTLVSLAGLHPDKGDRLIISSQRHVAESRDDQEFMQLALGRLWAAGTLWNPADYFGDQPGYRVALPTYPFDKGRYWVEPGDGDQTVSTSDLLGRKDDLAEWFYQPYWKITAPVSDAADLTGQGMLIFEHNSGDLNWLSDQLVAQGGEVTRVCIGEAFQAPSDNTANERVYHIRPASPEDMQKLANAVFDPENSLRHVIYGWNLHPELTGVEPHSRQNETNISAGLDIAFFTLHGFLQELISADFDAPPTLTVLTAGMQMIGGSTVGPPLQATSIGPVLVAPREIMGLRTHMIDLDPDMEVTDQSITHSQWLAINIAPNIAKDICFGTDQFIAYRANHRLVRHFRSLPVEAPTNPMPRLHQRGVYLITGGLGGVGLELAEYLAESLQARLILISRSGLPARAEWPRWLSGHSESDGTSRKIRRLQKMEEAGAEVIPAAVDVGDYEQLQAAVLKAVEKCGSIDGVFHTAGTLEDNLISLKNRASCERVLAPKIAGTLNLDRVFRDMPLDFMVLFSSVSALQGLPGQIDYAAANAFLDVFAAGRMQRDNSFTLAINWSTWRKVGMAARMGEQLGITDSTDAIEHQQVAYPLLDYRVDKSGGGYVYVGEFSSNDCWLLDEHRTIKGDALIPGTGYLELLRAAAVDAGLKTPLQFENVQFQLPFFVSDEATRELHIELNPVRDGSFDFSFISHEGRNTPGQRRWQEHVSGQVSTLAEQLTGEAVSIEALRNACATRLVEFSQPPPQQFLKFGDRWNNLRKIEYGAGQALLSLELNPEHQADLEPYALHPALVDMATAGAQELVPGFSAESDFYVPFSYGCIRILAPLSSPLYSHIRYRSADSLSGSLARFDIQLLNQQGTRLVEIDDFAMRRVDPDQFTDDLALSSSSDSPVLPLANNILYQSLADGILPAEGMEAIRRALSLAFIPQVAVSTQDLHRLMEQDAANSASSGGAVATQRAVGTEFVAPRTQLEATIAESLSELLGLDRVSVHDNFFEIGGHSLLAVRLFSKIHKVTGVNLPLATLFEAPTVAKMAAAFGGPDPEQSAEPEAVDSSDQPATGDFEPAVKSSLHARQLNSNESGTEATESPWSSLVPIQTNGSRRPFFCVHGRGGNVLNYSTLIPALGQDQPLYGLQSRGLDGATLPLDNVPDMAALYIEEMQQVQPQGPYYLGGGSMGGMVALEIAKQLSRLGEEVRMVIMFDTFGPDYFDYSSALLGQNFGRPMYRKIDHHIQQLLALSFWGKIDYLSVRVVSRVDPLWKRVKCTFYRLLGQPLPHHLRYWDLTERNLEALFKYDPGSYAGQVVILRAMEQPDDTYHDPLLGWGGRVAGQLRIIDIPGNHDVIVEEPELARNLSLLLSEDQSDL